MKKNNIKLKLINIWDRNNQIIIIYIFTVLVMIISIQMDEDFLSLRNMNNLVLTAFPMMMAAYGQMLILLTGGIDLSLGSMISLCNVVAVSLMGLSLPGGLFSVIVVTMLIGTLCGMLNGLFVTKGRLSPAITTIATMSVYGGIALAIRPIPGGKVNKSFSQFMIGRAGFATPMFLIVLITTIVYILTTTVPFGKRMRAIGGNEGAAYSTGIKVDKIKIITYSLAGTLASIAALFLTAQMCCGDASVGTSYTTNSIAIAVLGGTLLSGAVGNVLGPLVGAFLLAIINNILNLSGISSFYQYVFQGLILIIALAISSLRTKKI